MATFLTSDTHFGHKNIIDYCDRPYTTLDGHPDVWAMNRDLIARWNAVVGVDDEVLHLGDFAMGNKNDWAQIRLSLNGSIVLIKGNHDNKTHLWMLPGDTMVKSLIRNNVFMAHIPPGESEYDKVRNRELVPEKVPPGTTVMLCGHVHNLWAEKQMGELRVVNVGVDVRGFRPIKPEEIGVIL